MTSVDTQIPDLLLSCEEDGVALAYPYPIKKKPQNVPITHYDGDIYVVSDLHIASGRDQSGLYSGTENFFAESSFSRFLNKVDNKNGNMLVINGDFIDFIRIDGVPITDTDFERWERILAEIGIQKKVDDLKAIIDPHEKKYGLKTHDFKSVWKLDVTISGHPEMLDALADWLCNENRLVIVKGNHDLEWFWRAVRNYFRLALAKEVAAKLDQPIPQILKTTILPNVFFIDHSLTINDELYIEHGHDYERLTRSGEDPLFNDEELHLPFGSFFNRYVINKVELVYPFLDNVYPREKLLPLLVREHFFEAIKLLFNLRSAFEFLKKQNGRWYVLIILLYLVAILLPVGIMVVLIWNTVEPLLTNIEETIINLTSQRILFVLENGFNVLKNFSLLALSYFLARLIAYIHLGGAPSFEEFLDVDEADKSLHRQWNTFGHTHNPAYYFDGTRHYYNTGTWIPVLETSSRQVRVDNIYTFMKIKLGSSKVLLPEPLQRWNDDAQRAERSILIKRKITPRSSTIQKIISRIVSRLRRLLEK